GKALDPSKYFIIIPNMFGNGLSSSPSKTPAPFDRSRYPHFTMTDNVRVQQRLLQEVFGIDRLKLVYGFSMGAQQAFHWGALFPDRVERIGRAHSADLRLGKDLGAQFCLPRGGEGSIDGRSGLAGRLVRHTPDTWLSGDGAGLRRLGSKPSLLPGGRMAEARLFHARRLPRRQLGGRVSATRRERSARDAVDLAACRYQRKRDLWP